MNTSLLWLLVAVPLGTGAALAGAGTYARRIAVPAGLATATVTLGLAATVAAVRPAASAPFLAGIDAAFAVDTLSAVLVLTVAAVTLAVLVYATGEPHLLTTRFVGLMLLFAGAMLVTVTATTLPPLLMGWEAMGATSWALIGYNWREPRRVAAGHTAFLTTRAGDLGLYLAAGAALAGGVDDLALAGLPHTAQPWLTVTTVGVVLAALGKSAQLPFSFWLSRAMEGPSPVSALLHSAAMVAAGAYLLLRLTPLLDASDWGAPAVAWAGAVTALLLGLVAVAQRDLKQLLAASTCAQIGFMVLAAGAAAVPGGTLQLVAHAAAKSLLFLVAGAWLASLGSRQLYGLRGAARRHPVVGTAFTVGALTLAGWPPFSLWVGKDVVLGAALDRQPALYGVGLAAAVVAAFYSGKALWYVWRPLDTSGWDVDQPGTRSVARAMAAPAVALAVPAVALGALAVPLGAATGAAELAVSGTLAIAAAALAWWWGDRPVHVPYGGALRDWLHLEGFAHAVFVRPTLVTAQALAVFDDRVLDHGVVTLARAVRDAAHLADRRGELSVDGLVAALATGARTLGRLARRPQTGQLHQYYAQAAVGLAILALVLVLVSR